MDRQPQESGFSRTESLTAHRGKETYRSIQCLGYCPRAIIVLTFNFKVEPLSPVTLLTVNPATALRLLTCTSDR